MTTTPAPKGADIEQYRAGFEAWATGPNGLWHANAMARNKDGNYEDHVRLQFDAWTAAKRESVSGSSTSTSQGAALDERHEFERIMSQRGDAANYIGDGMYSTGAVQDHWEIWLARAELASAIGAAPVDALDARLIPCAYRVEQYRIEEARQVEGPALWAVRVNGHCLNKSGDLEWEPSPSGRDDEFLARCRFVSARDALNCLDSAIDASTTPRDA